MAFFFAGMLAIAPTASAYHYHGGYGPYGYGYHHHHYHGWGPGLLVGGALGLIAGAALSQPYGPYGYGYGGYPYGYSSYYGPCQRLFRQCVTHYGYDGPYRTCYHYVARVC